MLSIYRILAIAMRMILMFKIKAISLSLIFTLIMTLLIFYPIGIVDLDTRSPKKSPIR